MTLTEEIEKLLGTDTLDELVHDETSKMGSAINNDGIASQLDFLIRQRGYSAQEIRDWVAERDE